MNAQQKKTIAALQPLSLDSVEFYDVASRYFCLRLRVIRNCGLFIIFLAALSLALVFILWGNWVLNIANFVGSCICAILGWTPYLIGKYEARMIKTARKADTQHQRNALLFMATKSKSFRGDPVGAFILKQVNSTGQP
jgi:hypothetical protein